MHINRITTFPQQFEQIYYKLVKLEMAEEDMMMKKKVVFFFQWIVWREKKAKKGEKICANKIKKSWMRAQRGGKKSNKNYMA